ncbi:cob(I)yrinic acid a,c-diamide adenosyltransferase [Candidatus Bathyarchaeota archaeon]|nr:cob(I)yrinic acid a,c-diamide adenosyltransferase [Candidatus Bathyarchaeota archaeon]
MVGVFCLGYIYLYTGTGAGKTANALGLALRSVGHKRKVVIIQFLKWWKNTGEYQIRSMLKPYYEIYQFGRKGWIGLGTLDEEDKKLAEKGLKFAEKAIKEKRPDLLVLDEVNLTLYCGLLQVNEVIDFLDRLPKNVDVVLTGRYAPQELVERADFVVELVEVKAPKETVTTKGIQY